MSCLGVRLIATNATWGLTSAASLRCTPTSFAVSTGQLSLQVVKMKVTATTLPRKSVSLSWALSCVVSENDAALPILGSALDVSATAKA